MWNPISSLKHLVKDAHHLASDVVHVGDKLVHDAYDVGKKTVKEAATVATDIAITAGKTTVDVAEGHFGDAAKDLGHGLVRTGKDAFNSEKDILASSLNAGADLVKGAGKLTGDLNDLTIDSLNTFSPGMGTVLRLGEVFGESAINTAILQPLDGLSQLAGYGVHALTGYQLPELKLHITPDTKGLGFAGKLAEYAGDGVGFVAPLLLTGGATSALAGLAIAGKVGETAEVAGSVGELAETANVAGKIGEASDATAATSRTASVAQKFLDSKLKNATDGAITGFVFTPSNGKGNILEQRFEAAGTNFATFGVMGASSRVLGSATDDLLHATLGDTTSATIRTAQRLAVNGGSGVIGGITQAETASLLSGHGLASANDVGHSAAQFAFTGLAMDGLSMAASGRSLKPSDNGSPPIESPHESDSSVAAQTNFKKFAQQEHTNAEQYQRTSVDVKTQVDAAAHPDMTDWLNGPDAPSDLPRLNGPITTEKYFSLSSSQAPFIDEAGATGKMTMTPDTAYLEYDNGKKVTYEKTDKPGGTTGYKKLTQYTDNSSISERDGVKLLSLPGGVFFKNWHMPIESTEQNGSKSVLYGDGTKETTLLDGTEINQYPNNVTVTVKPDQTTIIQRENGDIIQLNLDGSKEVHSIEGTRSFTTPDGIITTTNLDGTVQTFDPATEISDHAASLTKKVNEQSISEKQVDALINGVAPQDKALASAFVDLGLTNSNDQALMETLRSMGDQIKVKHGTQVRFYAVSPTGLDSSVAYLFRKASDFRDENIENVSDIVPIQTGANLIFGDLSKLDPSQRQTIEKAQEQGADLVHIDLNNFEKGLNFTDFAYETPDEKLRSLISEAHSAVEHDPSLKSLNPTQLAEHVLNSVGQQAQKDLNIPSLRAEPKTRTESLEPRVSDDKINSYLTEHYPQLQDRLAAARLLDEVAQYSSLPQVARDLDALHGLILYRMGEKELAAKYGEDFAQKASPDEKTAAGSQIEQNAIYVVGKSSDAFISGVYQKVNHIDPSQFVSFSEFDALQKSGQLKGRPVVYLDDIAYTGSQLKEQINGRFSSVDNLILANLGSYQNFATFYWSADATPDVDLISMAGHRSLATAWQRDLKKGISENLANDLQDRVDFLNDQGRGDTYGGVDSYQIFSYMTSDTTPAVLKDYAYNVLNIYNPFALHTAPVTSSRGPLSQFAKYKWVPPQ